MNERHDLPLISFIIPAHNEESFLGRTLESIAAAVVNLDRRSEVIVVDDASTDRTAEIADSHGATVVAVELRQIAAARNAGAKAAHGDVLVFLDADTILAAETLLAALAELDSGAVGGGATVVFDGPTALWTRLGLTIFTAAARLVRWTAGCFVFVRRDAFEAVGGFDERYFAAEELVLSRALKRQGRFVILRQSIITSGRKGTSQELRHFAGVLLRLMFCGDKVLQRREGLGIWYERR
ncbi:MAG TPA: glycosyltransferase [Pirellulales bacterium]|nr:glycosyltransferase [Pirellulales bacterium]